MATKKSKIHPLLRVALAAAVWYLIPRLTSVAVNYAHRYLNMLSWLAGMLVGVLNCVLILLVMRFLVFFTKARFRETTLPMMIGMGIYTVVHHVVDYCMLRWDLRSVTMVFPSNSVVVAAVLFLVGALVSCLAWILCARNARNKGGYFAPVLLAVTGVLINTRVNWESMSVLYSALIRAADSSFLYEAVMKVPSVITFFAMLLAQWRILYKGQLDTRLGGGTDYDHGTEGNDGATRPTGTTPRPQPRTTPRPTSGSGDTPDFSGSSGLTQADMDRYWQEDAPAAAARPATTAHTGGGSIPETDLTREFEAAMRDSGGASHAADLLRGAPSNFE